ncbi:MAG: nuclear transport factor 2 family protein [Opitutaceae bacterium]
MPLNKTHIIILAIVVIIGGWFLFGGDSDERAIRRQLDQLVEIVEKDGVVSKFETLGRSRKFKEIFVEDALIEYLPGESLPRGADAMGAGFLQVWSQLESASIRISQHEVEVDASKTDASSTFYAACKIMLDGTNKMGDTVQYRSYWVKRDSEWLIERIVAESTH